MFLSDVAVFCLQFVLERLDLYVYQISPDQIELCFCLMLSCFVCILNRKTRYLCVMVDQIGSRSDRAMVIVDKVDIFCVV